MINKGVVAEVNGGKAKIQVLRESACGGNCSSCEGCELKNHFVDGDINTEFDFFPQIGDKVLITMDDKLFYRYTIIGYAVFVVMMILGAVFGYVNSKSENMAIAGAFLGILVAFVIVKLSFKNRNSGLKITKLNEESEV